MDGNDEAPLTPGRTRLESEATLRIHNGQPPAHRPHSQRNNANEHVRWIILILNCVIMNFIFYSFDIPASLHQEIKDYMPPSDDFEFSFNLLYTLYSLPNMILPLFGGYFVDRFGASLCMILFASFCCCGQFAFAIGMTRKRWGTMLLGRIIYGFGGESICVAYSTLLAKWFVGKEVALAFGFALAVGRLGSVLTDLLSPVVADSCSTPAGALWLGATFNAIALVTSIVLDRIDYKYKRSSSLVGTPLEQLTEPLLGESEEEADDEVAPPPLIAQEAIIQQEERQTELFVIPLLVTVGIVFGCLWMHIPFNNVASGILLERSYFRDPPSDCRLVHPHQCTTGNLQNSSNPSLDSSGSICPGHNYAPVLPTSINFTEEILLPSDVDCDEAFWAFGCTKDYCDALHVATEKVGRVMSIPYTMSALLSPFMGFVVDKVGHRAALAVCASLTLVVVHSTMAFATSISPVFPLIGQGVAYSLYASVLWPSVTLVVEEKLQGVAFGVLTCIQNSGLTLIPLVVAAIFNRSGQRYIPNVEVFFVSCALLGSVCGLALIVTDSKTGKRLKRVAGQASGR